MRPGAPGGNSGENSGESGARGGGEGEDLKTQKVFNVICLMNANVKREKSFIYIV